MPKVLYMSRTDTRLRCMFRGGRADTFEPAMVLECAPEISMLRENGVCHAIILWPRMIMASCNFHCPLAG